MFNKGNMNFGIGGRIVKIQVIEDEKVIQELDGFENLILNSGLDSFGLRSIPESFAFCAVGTGNVPPINTNTQLGAEAARTSLVLPGLGNCGTTRNSTTKWTYRRTFQFPVGALNGNYTELGFSWDGTANAILFSRVLIKSGGTSTAVTVTSSQQLRVVYEVYVQFDASVANWSLDFGGLWGVTGGTSALQKQNPPELSSYDTSPLKTLTQNGNVNQNQGSGWSLEPYTSTEVLALCSTNEPLAAIGSSNSRTNLGQAQLLAQPYTNGNYYRDKKASFLTPDANGTIKSMQFYNSEAWAALLTAPRVKQNTATLNITLRFSWGRI